mgnify:CR=1 FL=1
MSKEEIFETTIMSNINRKSVFVDNENLYELNEKLKENSKIG